MTTTSPSKNKKAAGESGGRAPYAATLANVPDFMRLEANELLVLLNVLRDPLAVHLYLLLLTQMDYTGGEFMSSYARLMELMTPPAPERGRRRPGPSYKQVRTALDSLIACGLVNRGLKNAEQGQLRLHLASRIKTTVKPPTNAARDASKKALAHLKNAGAGQQTTDQFIAQKRAEAFYRPLN
jgi:hypothetical protein